MKILWISPFFPYPPDMGLRIREFNLIRKVAQSHEVTLFSLLQSSHELQYLDKMREICTEVEAILPAESANAHTERRSVKDVLAGLFVTHPRYMYRPPYADVMDRLKAQLNKQQFDLVIVETLSMTNYVWDLLPEIKTTTLLVEHNIETVIQKQTYQLAESLPLKLRKYIYYVSFSRFERAACKRFDYVITVSEDEREDLLRFVPELNPARVYSVANGVDTQLHRPSDQAPQPNTLIYPGAVTYDANYDAVRYFVYEVLPLVRAQTPDVTFTVTGNTGHVDVSDLAAQPGVIFTGYLDSVAPAVQQSQIAVVPLRIGGGTRLKILEAMALGTPVISTSKGAEGINAIPGKEILIADTPQTLADSIHRLLNDADLHRTIATGGRALVEREYDWSVISDSLLDFINKHVEVRKNAQ